MPLKPNIKKLSISQYFQSLKLSDTTYYCSHGLTKRNLTLAKEVVAILNLFKKPVSASAVIQKHAKTESEKKVLAGVIQKLITWSFLFEGTAKEEEAFFRKELNKELQRNPEQGIQNFLNQHKEGQSVDLFKVSVARSLASLASKKHQLKGIFIGGCHVQFGMDLMREEASNLNIDLESVATFPQDIRILEERAHDFVSLGPLQRPMEALMEADSSASPPPHQLYVSAVSDLVEKVRKLSKAPILIDALPVPTVSPNGLADRSPHAHIHRVRQVNLSLLDLAQRFADVFIVDTDTALSLHGKLHLLDDSVVNFSHLGNLYWRKILPYPPELKRLMPNLDQIDQAYGKRDLYEFDRILARERLNLVVAIKGLDRKKCVVVDLDNTLWPGLLAERDAPFVFGSGQNIPLEFYGLHEALHCLKRRGILLACVSKNDEELVKKLWKYEEEEPTGDEILPNRSLSSMITLDDFASYRINWREKSENIREIAAELNIGLDSFIFIDDEPVEREKVRERLPMVEVLGDNFYTIRNHLLTHPKLQVPKITAESKERTDMVKAQIVREKERKMAKSDDDFLSSLKIEYEIQPMKDDKDLDRIHELIMRTNQFNTTTKRYSKEEIQKMSSKNGSSKLFSMRVKDRLTNYGLVGVCIVDQNRIDSFVMSCRVIGLKAETALMNTALDEISKKYDSALGDYIPTDRNAPARNLFKDHGFSKTGETTWERKGLKK